MRGSGTTIFAEMSALAREHHAVNLGQGFPDFDGPDILRSAVTRAMAAGHNQYAVSNGESVLRESIARHSQRFYRQSIDPTSEVTVTSGATEAIFCAVMALVDPGDEVIVFEPCYDSYTPSIRMAGGIAVAVTLHAPHYRFDPDELRAAVTPRTRAIIVNTPHNPTGTVFTLVELETIAALCREHDLVAITDEVYEHIVFGSARHHRLAMLDGMRERTVTISSAGKTFSVTGWKIGWAIAPEPLQRALRGVHQWTVFATSTPMQHAIAEALDLPDSYYTSLARDYEQRRDYLLDVLARTPLAPRTPEGSYFVMAGIERFAPMDAEAFARWITMEIGVAVIPPGSFYLSTRETDQAVRFCFCKSARTLEAAAERLVRVQA